MALSPSLDVIPQVAKFKLPAWLMSVSVVEETVLEKKEKFSLYLVGIKM